MGVEEAWKDIKGYEAYYQISNNGRVWSKRRNRTLKLRTHKQGYKRIGLTKDGKVKCFLVHRLVAFAFIPNKDPSKNQINHINGIKDDNRVENLEWCDGCHNVRHSYDKGLNVPKLGENSNYHVYTEEQIVEVKKLCYTKKYKNVEIAEMTGVHKDTVSLVKTGKLWKHVKLGCGD